MFNVELSGLARRTTVRGPKFEVPETPHPELRVALFPPVPPVSLGQASAIAAETFLNHAG
jgi:hypothetical protein